MSHTVTVTRTTTTTTTSAILLNIGYFKTIPGILKLLHIILGVICVSLVGHYIAYHKTHIATRGPNFSHIPDYGLFIPELFFLLIATTCLIASTLLLISCIISIATATILPKTVFEIVYHIAAMLLLLLASVIYIVKIESEYSKYKSDPYKPRLAAAEVTFFSPLTFLYFVASLNFLCSVASRMSEFGSGQHGYGKMIFISILGLLNSILYGVAIFFAFKSFKSG